MRLKKGFTILLVLFFLATITLSLAFIAENSQHDCTGDCCIICQMLQTADQICGGDGETSTAKTADAVLNFIGEDIGVTFCESAEISTDTPVSLYDLLTI